MFKYRRTKYGLYKNYVEGGFYTIQQLEDLLYEMKRKQADKETGPETIKTIRKLNAN